VERQIDPVDQLEMRVAIASSEERQRKEFDDRLRSWRDELRRDIRLYVGLGVMGGNAIAAVVIAKVGPAQPAASAVGAVRHLVGL
jgi:hypothetical protein